MGARFKTWLDYSSFHYCWPQPLPFRTSPSSQVPNTPRSATTTSVQPSPPPSTAMVNCAWLIPTMEQLPRSLWPGHSLGALMVSYFLEPHLQHPFSAVAPIPSFSLLAPSMVWLGSHGSQLFGMW